MSAGIATLKLHQYLLNAEEVGRNWQGCLLRSAMDGLQDAKDRSCEQFGSGLCNTGRYCADADDLRI